MSSKISIHWYDQAHPEFVGDATEITGSYLIEQNVDKLSLIKNEIRLFSNSIDVALEADGECKWNFFIDKGHVKTRRFKKFLPLIFRSISSDTILYDYQNEGVAWLRSHEKCILADDMGLGKTLQVIKACELEIFDRKMSVVI